MKCQQVECFGRVEYEKLNKIVNTSCHPCAVKAEFLQTQFVFGTPDFIQCKIDSYMFNCIKGINVFIFCLK